jgi:8-oxo-dGTP pyrophosphatase MutT (NUDIX family)
MYKELTQIHIADDDALHQNACMPAVKASKEAAVLIPLVMHNDQWQVLYIRRAHNERDRHSGQGAFPGGRREPSDHSHEHAALRETREEIGLSASQINVIGSIEPYVTVSSYKVTPIVGVVNWPATLNLQASEVARAFLVPLHWLRDRDNFTFRARSNMDAKSARRHPIVVYDEYDGETLWGATARMTLNFLKAIDDGKIPLPGRAEQQNPPTQASD